MSPVAGEHQFVFVGGLQRSGASRVASMLGHHRRVSVLRANGHTASEGEDVQNVFATAAAHGGNDAWAFSPAMRLTNASPACGPESAQRLRQSWEPYWDLSRDVLVERSAANLLRARFLEGVFPGASFIMVLRHPIAVVGATAKGSNADRGSRLEHWVTAHEAMAEDLAHLERALVVTYEDLVADSEREYDRMLQFLGLPWAPSVTDLQLGGNEPYYRAWTTGSPLARTATKRLARAYGHRVERFGYRLEAPYLAADSSLAAPVAQTPGAARAPRLDGATTGAGGPMTSTAAAPLAGDDGSSTRVGSRGELRSAARGGFAFTAGIVVSAIFQFAFLALAAHRLDQSDVGAFLEALAVFTICSNTAELGADTGLLRFSPIFKRRRPQDIGRLHTVALVPALVASVLVSVVLFIYAPQLVHLVVHHAVHKGASTVLRIFACFLPAVTVTTVMTAGLRAWTLRVPVLLNSFLLPIARPVLFVGFLVIGATATLTAIAWVAPTALLFAIAAVVLASKLRRTVANPLGPVASYREIAGEFWRFSLPRTFGAVLQILIMSLDVLLVGAFLSTRQAAAYSVASRYIVYGTFALAAISASVAPQMSRLMDSRNYRAVKTVYKSSTWWTIAASWPPLLVLAIFSPLFMSVFGNGYLTASSALTILALAMLANTGTGPNGALLQMAGRSGVILGMQALSLGVNVGLNIWLIPRIGLRGAAIAWLASILVIAILTSTVLWRMFGVEPFGRGYAIVAASALGCFGVLGVVTRVVFGTGVVTFLVFAVVSSGLYVAVLFSQRGTLNLDAFESLYGGLFRRVRGLRARVRGQSAA